MGGKGGSVPDYTAQMQRSDQMYQQQMQQMQQMMADLQARNNALMEQIQNQTYTPVTPPVYEVPTAEDIISQMNIPTADDILARMQLPTADDIVAQMSLPTAEDILSQMEIPTADQLTPEPTTTPEAQQAGENIVSSDVLQQWQETQQRMLDELDRLRQAEQERAKNRRGRRETIHSNPLMTEEEWKELTAKLAGVANPSASTLTKSSIVGV